MKQKWNKGFTVMELIIVVAIVAALSALAFIAVDRRQDSMYQLDFDGMAREIYFAAQNHLTQADTQGLIEQLITETDTTDEDKETKLGSKITGYKNNPGDSNEDAKSDVYYVAGYVDQSGHAVSSDGKGNAVLALMLPDYAIDAFSDLGSGTFFIIYQKSSATVLDVFYTSMSNSRFGLGEAFKSGDYGSLINLRGDSQKNARRNYRGAIIGYYGGENAQNERITLEAPELKVENAEKLRIIVTNPNNGDNLNFTTLKLYITGVKSGKTVEPITLLKNNDDKTKAPAANPDNLAYVKDISESGNPYSMFEIILDDITDKDGHFATKFADLLPGEDIQVQVKAYSSNSFANIVWSGEATTNSLFANPYTYTDGSPALGTHVEKNVAAIANFRHFENLDADISGVGKENSDGKKVTFNKAFQIADMDWYNEATGSTAFVQNILKINKESDPSFSGTTVTVNSLSTTSQAPGENNLYPVSPSSALAYDGQNHSISNVSVSIADNAGLFGTMIAGSSAKNFKLIDFEIASTGTSTDKNNAGALVGLISETDGTKITVSNVLAVNETKDSTFNNNTTGGKPNVTAPGNAGGLIGSMTGGTVEKSAAALYVKSTGGNAGGLIGTSSGGTVRLSYSGGHTISNRPDGAATKYLNDSDHSELYPVRYDQTNYNVTAATAAGGLIGDASGAAISNSYSTCSAKATDETSGVAGGLIGKGGTISNSYCTGLVSAKTEGAFAGSGAIISGNDCKYFEIINERRNKDDKGNLTSGYNYLKALGDKEETNTSVGKIDATAGDYQSFVGVPANDWMTAKPYDRTLVGFYGTGSGDSRTGRYNFKTVEQLAGSSVTFAAADFVKEHYGDWPAPEEFIFN